MPKAPSELRLKFPSGGGNFVARNFVVRNFVAGNFVVLANTDEISDDEISDDKISGDEISGDEISGDGISGNFPRLVIYCNPPVLQGNRFSAKVGHRGEISIFDRWATGVNFGVRFVKHVQNQVFGLNIL